MGTAKMLGTYMATGEIDMSGAGAFATGIRDTIDQADGAFVIVDCSGVTFMGSAGYQVLVEATKYAVRRGHTLLVCNLSSSCARLIRLCDADNELHVAPGARAPSIRMAAEPR